MQVSAEHFREFVAEKIDEYLNANPRTTAKELAAAMGVSGPTLSRWKSGQSNISESHYESIFNVLKITSEDLAKAFNAESFTLPSVRARGTSRVRGGGQRPPGPALELGQMGVSCRPWLPKRIFCVLFQGFWPSTLTPVARQISEQRAKLCRVFSNGAHAAEGSGWAPVESMVMAPQESNEGLARDVLWGVETAAQPGDMALVYLWANLCRDHEERLAVRFSEDRETTALAEFADWASRCARHAILVLDARWSTGNRDFPTVTNSRMETELLAATRGGLGLLVAASPSQNSEEPDWPFFSELLARGITSGEADVDDDGWITLSEACQYAAKRIDPLNRIALAQRASGKRATVVPAPRILSVPHEQDAVIAVRHSPESPA